MFKQAVNMVISSKEKGDYLEKELFKLGYINNAWQNYNNEYKILVTNFGGNNLYGYVNRALEHHGITAKTTEEFLAIAAMRTEEDFFVGEIVKCIDKSRDLIGGNFYKVSTLGKSMDKRPTISVLDIKMYKNICNNYYTNRFIKATLQEIQDFYNPKQMKEQIGWLFKEELGDNVKQAALLIMESVKLTEHPNYNNSNFIRSSDTETRINKAGVLEAWFNPVYKKEHQYKVGDWVYVVKSSDGNTNKKGDIKQIFVIDGETYDLGGKHNGEWESYENIRPATELEIKLATFKKDCIVKSPMYFWKLQEDSYMDGYGRLSAKILSIGAKTLVQANDLGIFRLATQEEIDKLFPKEITVNLNGIDIRVSKDYVIILSKVFYHKDIKQIQEAIDKFKD